MTNTGYFSFRQMWRSLWLALQVPDYQSEAESVQDEAVGTRGKVQISLHDLKIISSALLHFKRGLIKQKQEDRAREVADIDNRIYQLIVDLERENSLPKEPEVAA